ncbi:MAG: acyl-CoA dehydrogenase family protein [Polyangiales bacterium]
MSLPDRNNPYSFDEFLEWRNAVDFLNDDPFLLAAIDYFAPPFHPSVRADLDAFAERLSSRWQHLADVAGRPENAPSLMHFDGHNNRIDRIVRPAEALELEREIWHDGMFSEKADSWGTFVKTFLLAQLGEAGVGCAHCCTSGLILILERFADTPELRDILNHLKEGKDGEFAIGAQFLSEIQGGSDVQANRVEAVQTAGGWRIYGTKFYCSAAHADYAIITAKPTGSRDVAAFVVPSWLPGDKARERRNGFVINKLKSKLGTRELPSAEITFGGALAYPVGDLKRGLANIVGIVLAHSRFATGLGAGAYLVRASREARRYATWRTAFGATIDRFGLVRRQLDEIDQGAKRIIASGFKMQRELVELGELDRAEIPSDDEVAEKKRRFRLRMLVMLHKLVVSADSARLTETAMSIFGGHGLMEDFSSIPRIYRDAVVLNGAWEGPRNLLLTRIFMDMQRAAARWYPTTEFVADLLPDTARETQRALGDRLKWILAFESLVADNPATLEICDRWDTICGEIFHAYQDAAVAELVTHTPKLLKILD